MWETGGEHCAQSLVDTMFDVCGFFLTKNTEHYDIVNPHHNTASVEKPGQCTQRYTKDIKQQQKQQQKQKNKNIDLKPLIINATKHFVIVNDAKVHPGKMSGHNFGILVGYFSSMTVKQF